MRNLRVLVPSAALIVLAIATGYAQQQPRTFNFDSDAVAKTPTGFTSYVSMAISTSA